MSGFNDILDDFCQIQPKDNLFTLLPFLVSSLVSLKFVLSWKQKTNIYTCEYCFVIIRAIFL